MRLLPFRSTGIARGGARSGREACQSASNGVSSLPVATLRITDGRVELESRLTPLGRLLLGALALVPWLAPYELLFKPRWLSPASPMFLFALVISLGAIAVSAMLLMGALLGRSRRIIIERGSDEILEVTDSVLRRRHVRRVPLRKVRGASVMTQSSSDGPDASFLRLELDGGDVLDTPTCAERPSLEQVAQLVTTWRDLRLSGSRPPKSPG
jgi:hypothetical protein